MSYPETDPDAQAFLTAFREGLQKLGWIDHSNIRIDVRWTTPANAEAMQQAATELVALQPTFFLAIPPPLRSRCKNRHEPFLSFLRGSPIQSAAA